MSSYLYKPLYFALQRLLHGLFRTAPREEPAELTDWHLQLVHLELILRAQDQLHQEPLEREPQEQFLQMDRDPPRCGAGNTGTGATSAAPA